jgi:hypothetical protein
MEPEGSLPRPQEPSTGPYPEQDSLYIALTKCYLLLSKFMHHNCGCFIYGCIYFQGAAEKRLFVNTRRPLTSMA